MTFPSTLSTFSNPVATNSLDSPSHSSVEGAQNSTIGQIETVIGQDGGPSASSLGTIVGDLRNPDSGGGGHIQTAVKGGTGQTSFTKGDLLIAQSSSVIQKLAVGANDEALIADSNESGGVKWGARELPLLQRVTTDITKSNTTDPAVGIDTTILGSVLGSGGVIRGRVRADINFWDVSSTLNFDLEFGGTVVATCDVTTDVNDSTVLNGYYDFEIISQSNSAQDVNIWFRADEAGVASSTFGLKRLVQTTTTTSSILTDSDSTLQTDIYWADASGSLSFSQRNAYAEILLP